MRVKAVRPYRGRVGPDGLVDVYDLGVYRTRCYYADGVLVSNSKRISMLDVNALLSHGATETLRDVRFLRGQKNEDFWLQFMQGYTPRDPKVPLVYEKFTKQLQAAGINVVREGAQTHVMALTNRDVDGLAGDRLITSGDTVRFDKNLEPLPGGLFDPQLTGGHGGKRWSAIALDVPLPNPVMEEPIRRLLGLTQKRFEAVLAGEESVGKYGVGPDAIAQALDAINLPKETAIARAQIHSGRKGARDEGIRKLGYLKSCQKYGLHPRDWILKKAPVLPPAFRPVSVLGSTGVPLVADANYLYKELLEANRNLAEMTKELGTEGTGPERLSLYHAFKAVTGLGEPVTVRSREKRVKGILHSIFGSSPKWGAMQRKLLSSTVDAVGRAVIVPNPDYDMDTIGIPEKQAFEVYKKFIARRLHRRGLPLREALREIEDRGDLARDMLLQEMQERPVFVNRAPVLHRFGIMAFRPRLVSGDVIQVSPLIVKGFNADFDGDAMQFHVPTSDEAKREALERMLPSRNLLSPSDFRTAIHAPTQEYLAGLYHATTARSKRRPRVFRSRQDALSAYRRGEVSTEDPIEIME